MRAIWYLAIHDLRLLVTERAAFVFRLLLPVAFIFVIGIANDAFQPDRTPRALAIVDFDGSSLSAFFGARIEAAAEAYRLVSAGPDEHAVSVLLEAGTINSAILIPEGFGQLLRAGERVEIVVRQGVANPAEASRLVSLVSAASGKTVAAANADAGARNVYVPTDGEDAVADNAVDRALASLSDARVLLERTPISLPDRHELAGFRQSVPGMGSMFVMMSILAGASMLIEERKRWTLQRVMTTPISPAIYLSGKLLGRFLVGMLQFAVAIATAIVIGMLFGIEFGSSPGKMLVTMIVFVFCSSAIALFLATIVKREQQAAGLTTLIALTLAPIGGAWWSLDIEFIPDIMRKIAMISPFYWAMEGFRNAIHDLSWVTMLPTIAVLVLLGIGFFFGAAARFEAA